MSDFIDEREMAFPVMTSRDAKAIKIRACMEKNVIDLWELRELALTPGGLVTAQIRQEAWPLLVGLKNTDTTEFVTRNGDDTLDEKDADLIRRDAGRSVLFQYYKRERHPSPRSVISGGEKPTSSSISDQQDRLACVLEQTIAAPRKQGKIHYFQGLHDVAGVMLFNMEDRRLTTAILRRICQSHFRDALRQDFRQLTWLLDLVLLPLIERVDHTVYDFLVDAEVEVSNGVLPWIITWFSHDIHKEDVSSRLFDAFLCSHPMLPLYFAVALLTHPYNKQELIYSEPDPAMVYMTIRTFPSKIQSDRDSDSGITAQDLLDDALHIMRKFPPRSLFKLVAFTDDAPRAEIIEKCSCLSILKAPPSWAIASLVVKPFMEGKSTRVSSLEQQPTTTHRAKVASGVDMITKTVPFDTVLSQRLELDTSRETSPRAFHARSQWTIYKLLLFGRRRIQPY